MARIMSYEDNYFDICEKTNRNTVIYGAGVYAKRAFPYLKNVVYMCDKCATEISNINGITVISPEQLATMNEALLIVICIKSKEARKEIKSKLEISPIDVFVFDYFENIAFDLYREKQFIYNVEKRVIRNIHLIS